jgi:Xaa-Pro aminopeptidase
MKERRYTVLQHAEKAEDCNVVAAFEPQNVFYLTGFWGEAIAVCMDNGTTTTKLITPKLEYSRAEKTSIDCEVFATEGEVNSFPHLFHK